MPRILEGIRILEWTQFMNGSVYMLGDLGAEVIHIEDRVKGDAARGISAMWGDSIMLPGGRNVVFELANRSKKSLTVDLKKEKGREILYRLVEKSDAFVSNYRPAVAENLGLDYETLSKLNPGLVYVVASGLGTRGPFKDFRAFDPLTQACSGLMWVMGDRDDPEPVQVTGAINDCLGAAMTAYSVLAGLMARERLGIGQELEVSQLGSALVCLVASHINNQLWLGHAMARHSRTRARNPLANHYPCADGQWLMLSEAQSDRFWGEFCDALGLGEVEHDPRFLTALNRRKNYADLIAIVEKALATRPRDEWIRIFMEKGCRFSYAPIFNFSDVIAHPQVLENEYVVDFEHPTIGKTKTFGYPVRFTKTPASYSPAPEFGQHTEEVLLEVGGYSWEEIARLREEEVI
jgi:crotonobetainyl-CoA:carnitine CoA-transferase CaiB-like acyl-CoA transferase